MSISEIIRNDNVLLIMAALLLILLLVVIYLIAKVSKVNKRYGEFIAKLGNSSNIEEDLKNYMSRVERVEKQNSQLVKACDILDDNLKICIQKTGMVRYNAFRDTGSELSFALALLDRDNNGVVLNGIYSREMSNIYAKPVENGISMYKASSEEEQAIAKAVQSEKK